MLFKFDKFTPANLIDALIMALSTNGLPFSKSEVNFLMKFTILCMSESSSCVASDIGALYSSIRTTHFLLKQLNKSSERLTKLFLLHLMSCD